MQKKIIFLFFIFIGTNLYSQFINADAVRSEKDSIGFSGSFGLDIGLIKNTSTIFTLGNSVYIQYRKNRHLFFFINSLNIKTVNDEFIINKGTLHIRYNYKINNRITWEGFAQSHYNRISKIDKRQLVGTGPRFTIFKEKKFDTYLGTLLMYEHEKIDEVPAAIYNDDIRLSGYLTFRLFPTKNFTLSTTTFYQPKINKFSDYRIYSHNSVMFKVFKNLSIGISYIATYDTEPASGIPKYQYRLLNGLAYTFD